MLAGFTDKKKKNVMSLSKSPDVSHLEAGRETLEYKINGRFFIYTDAEAEKVHS